MRLPRLALRSRPQPRPPEAPTELQPLKLEMIDRALEISGGRSLADLGGVWAVDGGYTFHALDRHAIDRAFLVDDDLTPEVRERARAHPQLELVERNFGDPQVAGLIGSVDVVLLFDVLLHQVAPDWDEVLAMYAGSTRCFAVVQPQWVAGEETVRLLDLGREEYLASVPPQEAADEVFERMHERHPRRGRAYRDIHDIWQWGISDRDLVAAMRTLGFGLAHDEDAGRWQGLERFHNRGFVFLRAAEAG